MLSDVEQNKILLKLVIELNEYLKERWNKLPRSVKKILGLEDEDSRDSRVFAMSQWTSDFYKQKILDLEDDLRGNKE